MSHLIVMTFEGTDEASRVRDDLRRLQRADALGLDDAAVMYKDEHGNVGVKNELDVGVKYGMAGGGLLGLMIAWMFPIAGLAVGALLGALAGHVVNLGIDSRFIADVKQALQPGHSALVLLVRDANTDLAIGTLRAYRGEVYHTTLPPDLEATIAQALQGNKG